MIGVLALVVAVAGCGSSASMSDTASRQLEVLVASVRTATVARDRPRAKHALATLRHSVRSFVVSGDISKSRAAEILGAVTLVEARLAPFTTTTTTTTTTTVPPPRDEHHDRPKHHGKDRGPKGDEG